MAEFLIERREPIPDGFAAIGKPIPIYRCQAALNHAKSMGCTSAEAFLVVKGVAEQLERDQPYEAMAVGMRYLDLTGTYRLFAALLTAPKPRVRLHINGAYEYV